MKSNLPKFNTAQKGLQLAQAALPEDTPDHMAKAASGIFNASIAAVSGKIYRAIIPHMRMLEATLDRPLTTPSWIRIQTC